jgi:hypothetical protein
VKTRIVQALGLAVVLALFLTTVAAAEHGAGTGTLTAKGNGLAALRGDLSVTLTGSGLLVIRDQAGDATIAVTGRGYKTKGPPQGKEFPNGTIAYFGFDGKAEISGSAITVSLRGSDIELEATGTGKFLLRGHGSYHTDKGGGAWTEDGAVVTLP